MKYINSWGIIPLGAAILLVAALLIISGCTTVEDFVDDAKEEIKKKIRDKVDEVLE
ncbi:hypothetical protein LCGC14_2917460 [marine sediment metagenome]|uniref:Uncharacterized protein n=1 Tax=marine sediment metagenome TaxID=412755 RepID=A0A0F8YBP0_9ZZZZ